LGTEDRPSPGPPVVSVVLPAWNSASTVGRAIESVLSQDGVALECLVVDDGSTDGTADVVGSYAARDPRVVLLRQSSNAGVSAARNRALDAASGAWLAFLDADDRLRPGALAAMLAAASRDDALVVIGQRISTDGERTWVPRLYDLPDIREPGRKSVASNPGLLSYAGPAGKLIHRSCTTGLRFEGRVLGDQPWILRALLRAGSRLVVIDAVVYEWWRPHPARYVPTITAARERSARLAADAVVGALAAFEAVGGEIEVSVETERRDPLRIAYLERLVTLDLAPQLRRALVRGDPDLSLLFDALATFLSSVPPAIVRATPVIASEVLEPPLAYWPRVPADARAAYRDLVRAAIQADPGVTAHLGPGAALALRSTGGLAAPPIGRAMAPLVSLWRPWARLRHLLPRLRYALQTRAGRSIRSR
jgi:hypothetical protein